MFIRVSLIDIFRSSSGNTITRCVTGPCWKYVYIVYGEHFKYFWMGSSFPQHAFSLTHLLQQIPVPSNNLWIFNLQWLYFHCIDNTCHYIEINKILYVFSILQMTSMGNIICSTVGIKLGICQKLNQRWILLVKKRMLIDLTDRNTFASKKYALKTKEKMPGNFQ